MADSGGNSPLSLLLDLLTGAETIEGFLTDLSRATAATISHAAGTDIECAVTLRRSRRMDTTGGSSARALELARMEHALADGPCTGPLLTMGPVLLNDLACERRWPGYRQELERSAIAGTWLFPWTSVRTPERS
ncbi:UNVERIFIED_ORG: hypothetical protein ABIB19_004033 [Arthrobacter sp. UYEF10]